jgi:hypothetical protein
MDNRANPLHNLNLFSRGATPPVPQSQHQQYPSQHLSQNSSPSQIDNLFHHLSSPPEQHQSGNDYGVNSAPNSPVRSLTDEPANSSVSALNNTAADRQSALLSLLGGPSGANARGGAVAAPPLPQQVPTQQVPTQQVPTPPGSSQRSGASPTHNEAQGKILLEQLMAG